MRNKIRGITLGFAVLRLYAQAPPPPAHYRPTHEELRKVEEKTTELEAALRPLRGHVADEVLVDAEVYLKAARLIVRFDEFYSQAYVDQTLAVLDTGLERARQLASGNARWTKASGSISRAYRSRVDGSVQPYALTIPENYTGSNPEWLEVVLHGRGATLNEVSFLYAHDRAQPAPADHEFIELDVFGRGNNAYRWAGETDIFEAIESVKKRYRIDPERIVLRGFSMGGAGAWHVGLHYPDQWAAVEAGAGFVETRDYAHIENPPPYVHIYDALDYAVNAENVPIVGYGGEDDPQLRASVLIRKALAHEGYSFKAEGLNYESEDPPALFLTGPKTQHRWHPESKNQANVFMLLNQSRGRGEAPKYIHFVTYTERYNHCYWIKVDQLQRQYERARVDGEIGDRNVAVRTHNVSRLTLHGEPPMNAFSIDGQEFPIASSAAFERSGGVWRLAAPSTRLRKQHGLQGPIDDAFMDSFLCVPADASAPKSEVDRFAQAQLDRFSQEFARWMRGEVRVRTSQHVTAAEVRSNNVVAFGTPWSNPLIAQALPTTPVHWSQRHISIDGRQFEASRHMLSMIYPNPSNPKRYLVINSGHTFHDSDFAGTNALLYPRVGDWAVTDVRTGKVVAEGVFDRNWAVGKQAPGAE